VNLFFTTKVVHINIHYLNPLSERIPLLLKSYLKRRGRAPFIVLRNIILWQRAKDTNKGQDDHADAASQKQVVHVAGLGRIRHGYSGLPRVCLPILHGDGLNLGGTHKIARYDRASLQRSALCCKIHNARESRLWYND